MSDMRLAMDNRKILIVDDNAVNVLLLEKILKQISTASTISAADGNKGVARAESDLPDLILLDINLPDIDGFEVLNKLKSSEKTKNIPVIALSANAMPKDVEMGKNAGFNDYLTKPINFAALAKAIDIAMGLTR
jgi:CheY-like chemotaxis protein